MRRFDAAAPGPRGRQRVGHGGLLGGGVGRGLCAVEQGELLGDHLLGLAAEEARVGELDLLDDAGHLALELGDAGALRGGLGRKAGVLRRQLLVVARERLDLRPQKGYLPLGGHGAIGMSVCSVHGYIIP